AASSILVDDTNPDTIWVGISNGPAGSEQPGSGGAAVGTYNPTATSRPWTWTPLGSNFPTGGGVDLARLGSTFFAAVYSRGVYKLGETGSWDPWSYGIDTTMSPSCTNPNPPLHTSRIAVEPRNSNLFVALGNPFAYGTFPELCRTGVWESVGG